MLKNENMSPNEIKNENGPYRARQGVEYALFRKNVNALPNTGISTIKLTMMSDIGAFYIRSTYTHTSTRNWSGS